MNYNLRQVILWVFLPALLLLIFFSASSSFFFLGSQILFAKSIIAETPLLKLSTVLPQIVLVAFLFILSLTKPFEKVFKITLLTLIVIVFLFLPFLLFETSLPLKLQTAVSSYLNVIFTVLNLNIFSLFVWGFINRLTSVPEGFKYYIPLSFALGLFGGFFLNLDMLPFHLSHWPLLAIMSAAIFCLICALLIFHWSWKRLPQERISPENASPAEEMSFPYLSSAYLLAGSTMIRNLLDALFKPQKQAAMTQDAAYQDFIRHYAQSFGFSVLALSILWLFLGTWLLLKKGWKTTAFYASLSLLFGGSLFLIFSIGEPATPLSQGLFNGFFVGTQSALFFPLVQILYLHRPYRIRFRTKIVTELIALPLMKAAPAFTVQGLLALLGSLALAAPYLKALAFVLMLLLVVASRRSDKTILM